MMPDHKKIVQRVTVVGLVVNLALFAIKIIFGVWGRSSAVVADAVHSLSDLSTDLAVLLGVYFWTKPADEDHPYGHGKIETLVSAFIGIALIIVAVGLCFNALRGVRSEVRSPSIVAFWAAILSIGAKEILYRWTIRRGKEIKSSAVIANAWHHRSDAFSSIPVAVAVAVAAFFPAWAFVDKIGALVVSIFIIGVAGQILYGAFHEIIDTSACRETQKRLERAAMDVKDVRSVHALRTRRVGGSFFVDLHVQVEPNLTVFQGHEIAAAVKYRLLKEADIVDVMVHLEPYSKKF